MAISAAISAWRCVPPSASVKAAAAIEEDTPISAWQPPIAAEMVEPFLNMLPTSAAVNKKLMITELPNADVRITPSVEIQSMDDSFLNRISEKDIKNVQQKAKMTALKSIDQNKLRSEAKKQLMENLDHIFVLAKALNYTIEDKTGKLGILKL